MHATYQYLSHIISLIIRKVCNDLEWRVCLTLILSVVAVCLSPEQKWGIGVNVGTHEKGMWPTVTVMMYVDGEIAV